MVLYIALLISESLSLSQVIGELELARLIHLAARGKTVDRAAAQRVLSAIASVKATVKVESAVRRLLSLTRSRKLPSLRVWAASTVVELAHVPSHRSSLIEYGVSHLVCTPCVSDWRGAA